ncbi:MAG: ABC transporter ATP-binding protein/permease [Betaproteobacteria bacterium]|nr:ABC transporter ATP-binding protein/permease [Betaproteobacteria bacterium]
MSRDHRRELPPADLRTAGRSDWQTLRSLFPYLWAWKGRVAIALGCLVAAKMANVGVPIVLKSIIDWLAPMASGTPTALRTPMGPLIQPGPLGDHPVVLAVAVPAALLVSYGLLRLATSLFTELREFVFAKVTQRAVRTVSLQVFGHLHALSLRFHLDRQTGGLTRDVERGSRGISTLVSYTLYSILPTLVEVLLVLGWLATHYEAWFAGITVVALTTYIVWTVTVTNWRTHFRREMNDLDSKANTRAIDSLLNYETVKYFGNEAFEANRYDESLQRWERAAVRSQTSLSLLNTGQSAIIATAVTMMVWRATVGVVEGRMSLGDLVLVNAFMIQLYIPLNFLGVLYREIKQSLTDIEKMFGMLDANREVDDVADAPALRLAKSVAAVGPEVRFEKVSFSYQPDRQILRAISFVIAPGTTVAVVGSSGAGKSTLARLLYRFYDVNEGRITIDGQDLRQVTQASLRAAIGIVPQDTVLFNDSIAYNIAYGRPGATQDQVEAAARSAQLHDFIARLPQGYDTPVGERGLKLSGGEKQRVAIARMLLKDPPILVLDEATSALDSSNEQAIQQALREAAARRTTLVIAHRLSTVVDANLIIVLEDGQIVQQGTHDALLLQGGRYSELWAMQARDDGKL